MTHVSAPPDRAVSDGLAPGGMIWVAWRQRRSLILITLGLYGAATAVLVVVRTIRARELASSGVTDIAGCRDIGMTAAVVGSCERWLDVQSSWSGTIGQLSGALSTICVLFGLGLGAAVVGHELEHGLSGFSFSQGISSTRWAATQLGMVVTTSMLGITILDLLSHIPTTGRAVVGDDPGGPLGAGVWAHAALILAMVCLGFGMSVVSGSSSGGFWGGLGVLVVGGLVMGLLVRPTASALPSAGVSVPCTGPADELCGRVSATVARFQSLTTGTATEPGQGSTVALCTAGLLALVGGFLLLRRRFR